MKTETYRITIHLMSRKTFVSEWLQYTKDDLDHFEEVFKNMHTLEHLTFTKNGKRIYIHPRNVAMVELEPKWTFQRFMYRILEFFS